jgi:WD40 repeat protein/serine/threonine protein kinase
MNSCPSAEVLERLLDGTLPEEEAMGMCAHLAGCAQCQVVFDRMIEKPEWKQWASVCWPQRAVSGGSHPRLVMEPALAHLLERLHATPAPDVSASADTAEELDNSLSFLGPPVLPGDLGSLGPYRVLAEVGRGGMGIVLRAYDPELRRTVALKVLPPDRADAKARMRFVREAQAAAGIEHEHVVPVYAVANPTDGPPYLVMQYVEGPTLRQRLEAEGRLDPHEAARICQQAADGLAAAHGAGLVHRDVKPGNIMLEKGTGRAKIMDFGLVRMNTVPGGMTQDGTIPGTPEYVSPEQVRQPAQVDARSDVYSLGVTLYEALTGEVPFRGVAHLVLQQVLNDEPRPPRRLNDRMPRDLETICLHCLHKEPGQRYPSAGALAEDLRRFLAGEPIQARPIRSWERVVKWARRRPAIAALLALVVLLTVSGFGLVTWQWRRAETARWELADKANELTEKARQLQIKNYVRNIALAANEIAMGNTGRAEELLDECLEDLRDWEWHYLKRRLRDFPPLTLPLGQRISGGKGFDFAFSPDGRQLAAPCGDQTIRVWEASTGKELLTLRGHRGAILRLAFSPDGRRLASASEDTTIKVWNMITGQEVFTLRGHTGPVNGLAFSPEDSRYLASTSSDQTVRLWDATTGELHHTFPGSFPRNTVVTAAFSPDGRRLVAGGEENTVKVWDVVSGREVCTLPGHTDRVFSVAFSPDGQRLVTAGWEGSVKVWDVTQSQEICTLREHSHGPWCVAFSADGRRLAVGEPSPGSTVKVYDALTGQNVFTLESHSVRVVSVAFSPDGRRLASASQDKTVKVWEMETGQELLTLREHTNLVGRVVFDPQGRRLASSSEDGTIRIWDGSGIDESSDHQILTLHGHARTVWGVAFSPDGRRLASAGADKLVKVWDVTTGQEIFALGGHEDAVLSVAFSPNGEYLASASNDKSLKLWNVRTGEEIRTLTEFRGGVSCVAFSPDGRRLATSDATENVRVWDAATGQKMLSLSGHKGYVRGVMFILDGRFLATGSVDGTVRLWDASTGQEVRKLEGHINRVLSLAYSPKNRLLASGDADQKVKVWEAATGNDLLSLPGHTNYVIAAAFSPDGERLASASWQEVIIWDTRTGEKIKTLRGLVGPIQSVAFSRDGKLAAAGGYKGKGEIKIWDASLWDNKLRK